MKTSNNYIVAFLSLVLAGMLTLFILTKMHKVNYLSFSKMEMGLPPFSVIVGLPDTRFNVESSDKNKLVIQYVENIRQPKAKPYFIKNDTLFVVEKLDSSNLNRTLLIQCNGVRSIHSRQTKELVVNFFNADSLTLFADEGSIYLGQSGAPQLSGVYSIPPRTSRLKKLSCRSTSSYMHLANTQANQLVIQSNRSKIQLGEDVRVRSMMVDMKDNSCFSSNDTTSLFNRFELQTDSTSRYEINRLKTN